MNAIRVFFTMDCERIAAESPSGGPESWQVSERAIRGFCDRILGQGYKVTLFLIPECAMKQADLFGDLAECGVELGLHVHTHSLLDFRYSRYLGEYDAATQREIIGLAADMMTRAIGVRPVAYRSGNSSASDETYGVLYDHGFREGSVSDPGRYVPNFAADWRGAYPDPHHVDRHNKLIAGDLPFFEVPITTNPARLQPNGFPYELRIESGPFADWHQPIFELQLQRFARQRVGFPAFCIFTHNYFAYDQPGYAGSVTLQEMLDYLAQLRRIHALLPATLHEAHADYRTYLARQAKQ